MTMGHSIGKCSATFGLYFAFIALCYPVFAEENLEIEVTAKGEIGSDANFNCSVSPETADIQWTWQGVPIGESNRTKLTVEEIKLPDKDRDGNTKKRKTLRLSVGNVTQADAGNYMCLAKIGDKVENKSVTLDLTFPGRLVNKTTGPLRLNVSVSGDSHVKLYCLFEVYDPWNISNIGWYKKDVKLSEQDVKDVGTQLRPAIPVGLKQVNGTFDLHITAEENGTYVCEIKDKVTNKNIQGEIDVIVYDKPKIVAFNALPINTTQIYINWTVNNYNSPVEMYSLFIRESPSENFNFYTLEKIGSKNTSFVINNLNKSTEYQLKLEVKTKGWTATGLYVGKSTVKTLDKEPVFVPKISINGFSATSVTIGWPPPPEDIAALIHYYHLEARKNDENKTHEAYHPRDSRNLPYMFGQLDPHSTYIFRVRACSEFTRKQCGPWSDKMEAATLDGIPGKPSNVHVNCDGGYMNITWDPPEKPNAEIKGYTMELTGNATYRDRYGTKKEDMWGPLSRFTTNDSRSARFDDLQPNSNYTVRLSAMTRTRRRGEEETRHCETPPHAPDAPPRPRWRKILENNKYMFKMYLPRITERNGRICCYRVHMVRMLPNVDWKNLPPPKDMSVIDYDDAHNRPQPTLGGYITDIFSNDKFPSDSELIMGDGNSIFDKEDPTLKSKACRRCLLRPRNNAPDYLITTTSTTTSTTTVPTTTEDDLLDDSTADPIEPEKTRRSLER
ncbi:unnamed protein product [Diatraea saccharalis]|uniref:Uncharacterized protein n=1 Tax=Diatraea saccharalis TaxID=40085 RepID=A0A9N9RG24_9NEOP|nr:unnamed protein product [Diatraea saccharalis]